MRKFKKGGKRGTSKKKMMRKVLSSAARQVGIGVDFHPDMLMYFLCSHILHCLFLM